MTRRILITGFATESRKESPVWNAIARRQYEVWSFNNDLRLVRHAQRHFEMHELEVYGARAVDDVSPDPRYLRCLREGLGIPVYMLRAHDDIPGSVAYPIEVVTELFGTYFTNSISYMLALAIMELAPVRGPAPEIHLYGIDMAREHEHGWERPSIEFFLGWARGAGIKVVVPDTSDLLKCMGLYGYVNHYEDEAILRERLERMLANARTYELAAEKFRGIAEDIGYWLTRGVFPGDGRATSRKAAARRRWLLDRAKQYRDAARSWGEHAQREEMRSLEPRRVFEASVDEVMPITERTHSG